MDWWMPPGDALARLAFTRGLALVYLIAFVAALRQFRPLLGERGLLPIPRFIAITPFRRSPSVFHVHYSDRFFAASCWAGIALATLALVGLVERSPIWTWVLVWATLWALQLSILNVGQRWYGFGWEILLAEAGFLAIFVGPAHVAPPLVIMWALRWLLFRVEFGAGLVKLRGDRCWRDLTCLDFHHETQPMPNPFSRSFHRLPSKLHRVEVLANHVTQLVVVFGLFAPQPIATVAAMIIIVTQGWLMLSGNFAWLNLLTAVLALCALDGRLLAWLLPVGQPIDLSKPAWFGILTAAVAVGLVALSYQPVRNLLSKRQQMNASFDSLRLVNTYGAFGSVTKERREVVFEATDDPSPGPETVWLEYEFKAKPTDVSRRPPQFAPYHLRLDWLMWFVAISPAYGAGWLQPFVERLAANDPGTRSLLRRCPFEAEGPAFVRARLYRYRFTSRDERRATGNWWHRTYIRELIRPVGAPPTRYSPR